MSVIWPNSIKPDVAVSVGTGCSEWPFSARPAYMRGILRDGYVPRLLRSLLFSPSLDGQNGWAALMNRISEIDRDRYFRLNLSYEDQDLALDDVDQMSQLQERAMLYILDHHECSRVARALWGASFFFELDSLPSFLNGLYHCQGSILCRRPYSKLMVEQITQRYPRAAFLINNEESSNGTLTNVVCCSACGYFRQFVHLETQHLDENIDIRLSFDEAHCTNIGGMPQSVSWYIVQQGLNLPFGRPDHGRSSRSRDCGCMTRGRRKRRAQSPTGQQKKKHRS